MYEKNNPAKFLLVILGATTVNGTFLKIDPMIQEMAKTNFFQILEVDMLRKIFYIAGGLFLSFSLLASMGLGAWGYDINNKLEQSQADYAALQSDYNELDSEYSQSKADYESKLDQAQTDLEDAQADLENAQARIKKLESDLDQAQSENKSLKSRISAIQSKVSVLNAFWFTSDSAFAERVEKSDDKRLQKLYKALSESQSWDDFVELMSYLIRSISDESGISWQPAENAILMRNGRLL